MDKETFKTLLTAAKDAAENAYCNYSKFVVGAAIINDKGQVFSGCNIENSSYGLSICAERVAVYKLVSEGYKNIRAIVIYTPTQQPTPPCGACRQVISEFNKNVRIISICDSDKLIDTTLDELFPNPDIPL